MTGDHGRQDATEFDRTKPDLVQGTAARHDPTHRHQYQGSDPTSGIGLINE